jgi:hypothetical protein
MHALDACTPGSAGTGARFSAREIASTLAVHHAGSEHQGQRQLGSLAQCVSHPPPFTAAGRLSALVKDARGRW